MRKKRLLFFITLLFLLISFIIFTFKFGPEYIVNLIGLENTYLVIFIVAIIGGVSAITSTSFYALFITFIMGGANPVLLIFLGGLGLTIGDSVFFYLGYKGREVALKSRFRERILLITNWLKKHSKKFIFGISYIYVAFSPFPKDILSSILGLSNFSFRYSIIAFLFGNITHCFIITLFLLI